MNGMINLMEFIIRDGNRWTTFAAILESNGLGWTLADSTVLVLVALPNIDLANISRMKQMVQSMQDDILFLEINADNDDVLSLNNQIKTLTTWLNKLNHYRAWS